MTSSTRECISVEAFSEDDKNLAIRIVLTPVGLHDVETCLSKYVGCSCLKGPDGKPTQHKHSLVDQDFFDSVKHLSPRLMGGYVFMGGRAHDGQVFLKCLHLMVVSPPPGLICDHLNLNKFDNRRVNLRVRTFTENSQNRPKMPGTSSSFVGVTYNSKIKSFRANAFGTDLGCSTTEIGAAELYNAAVLYVVGVNAKLNDGVEPIELSQHLTKRLQPIKERVQSQSLKRTVITVNQTLEERISTRLRDIKANDKNSRYGQPLVLKSNRTSKYRGVVDATQKNIKYWGVVLETVFLHNFKSEESAGSYANLALRYLYGEHATVNDVPDFFGVTLTTKNQSQLDDLKLVVAKRIQDMAGPPMVLDAAGFAQLPVHTPEGLLYTTVDPKNYCLLARLHWILHDKYPFNARSQSMLHDFVCPKASPEDRRSVDHINGLTLDNREENLRRADNVTQLRNRAATGVLKMKGVKQYGNKFGYTFTVEGKLVQGFGYNSALTCVEARKLKLEEIGFTTTRH